MTHNEINVQVLYFVFNAVEKLHVNLAYSIDSELRDYWFRKNCKHVHCRDGPVYDIKYKLIC